jgi:hypothetical protein
MEVYSWNIIGTWKNMEKYGRRWENPAVSQVWPEIPVIKSVK